MSERNVSKDRTCQICHRVLRVTAKQMVEHAVLCKRAQAIGIVIP